MADDELLAHRPMCLASALPRSSWAPHDGLRRFAAAPGLLLVLVVIELVLVLVPVLVALHQLGMAAKITLVLVATRYKTRYKWLRSGYTGTKEKGPATIFIVADP